MTTNSAQVGAEPKDRFGLAAPFGTLVFVWLPTIILLLGASAYRLKFAPYSTDTYYLVHQDLLVLGLELAVTVVLGLASGLGSARFGALFARSPRAWACGLAVLVGVIGVIGAPFVFEGYTLSLDEFLANFDAQIFASGQLMAPVSEQWQPFASALQPMYLLPTPDDSVWASSYLPVNAALRALASLAGLEGWVNPLLSAASVALVYAVARRLWPGRPGLALAAAALLASSSQLVVTSMTAYAMPGHLALNLAWLWLFLRGGRLGHAGAVLVAFLATGLHQLIFHPLFAAPFVLQLWLDRRWRIASLYTIAYALIGLFWIEYWQLELRLVGISPEAAHSVGGGWFLDRIAEILAQFRWEALSIWGQSLVRFVTWQNPLTTPLALIGLLAAVRAKGNLRALALGVVLTLAAVLVLVPSQTNGWGYRYLHGLLGSICLLATWSWARLTDGLSASRRATAAGGFALACAISLLVLTPLRTWQAWRYCHPYAVAEAQIRSARTQVVIVDHEMTPGFDAGTLVRNDPFLRGGPKVMELSSMDEDMLRELCSRYSVAMFDGRNAAADGVDVVPFTSPAEVKALRALVAKLECAKALG